MRKKLFVTVLGLVSFISIYAGGLLTNTNQSVTMLRNPARGASIEIDAAYTNPAGLAFLKKDGFFLSLNNQSAFQTRTITADYAPFGNDAKKFKGEAKALFIPNLQAAYKIGDLVFSTNIGVVGGGGTLDFSKGLPMFESAVAVVPAALAQHGFAGYKLDSQLKGTSITYGFQLGATYKIIENFSAHLGFRYSHVNNSYEGNLKNVQLGMDGTYVPSSTILANPNFAGFAPLLAERDLDCKQTGSGLALILGLDYNWNGLNVGVKYESKTALDLNNTNNLAANNTGVADYDDGAVIPYDIPAIFSLGAQYDVLPQLTVSAGYHHFFDSSAKMSGDKQEHINGGINEYLLGAEYRINEKFLVSCGGQITRTGVTDAFQSDMNFSLNSYSLGIGGAVNVTENIRINLAYLITNYNDWSKESTDYGNFNVKTGGSIPPIKGIDTYGRTNSAFGIGLEFRF